MTDADGADWPPMPLRRINRIVALELPQASIMDALRYAAKKFQEGESMYEAPATIEDPAICTIREERAAARAAKDLEAKRAKVEEIENRLRYTGDGTVIKFSKKFGNSDKVYMYAAINTNGRWYTTGQTNQGGFTNEDFVLWLANGEETKVLDVYEM